MAKTNREIRKYVKDSLELYGYNYKTFLTDASIDNKQIEKVANVLGVKSDDIINCSEEARNKWYSKYCFFELVRQFNAACHVSKLEDNWMVKRLVQAIFGEKAEKIEPRYNDESIKSRVVDLLKKYNTVYPGVYRESCDFLEFKTDTDNFCSFKRIDETVMSLIEMFNNFKTLFFKAINEELSEEEILEYNFLASALCVRDNYLGSLIIDYKALNKLKKIYYTENYNDIFSYIHIGILYDFHPWKAMEFVENKELPQLFIDTFGNYKPHMRKFATDVSKICCSFVWSNDKEELERIKNTPFDELAEEMTEEECNEDIFAIDSSFIRKVIYVDKTTKELRNDGKFATRLMQMCGPEKKGGLRPAKRELNREESQKLFMKRITDRLQAIRRV